MPAATENSRFIIKPAVHEFNNSLFHYSNFNFKYVVIKIVLFIFDAYFKKKKMSKKPNVIHAPILTKKEKSKIPFPQRKQIFAIDASPLPR